MKLRDYNKLPVAELLRLHEEEHYTFIVKNGRILPGGIYGIRVRVVSGTLLFYRKWLLRVWDAMEKGWWTLFFRKIR